MGVELNARPLIVSVVASVHADPRGGGIGEAPSGGGIAEAPSAGVEPVSASESGSVGKLGTRRVAARRELAVETAW